MNRKPRLTPAPQRLQQGWTGWLQETTGTDGEPPHDLPGEPVTDGALHLLDLVAAVDHLARGHRPDLTVWDALDEALRRWTAEQTLTRHGAPDPDTDDEGHANSAEPLHGTLHRFLATLDEADAPPTAEALQQAVRHWTTAMAQRHNAGHHWPHPVARRSFPPPLQNAP